MTNFENYADISFLASYAVFSLLTFAALHHLLVPIYGRTYEGEPEILHLPSRQK
jgi:hypothetical protein